MRGSCFRLRARKSYRRKGVIPLPYSAEISRTNPTALLFPPRSIQLHAGAVRRPARQAQGRRRRRRAQPPAAKHRPQVRQGRRHPRLLPRRHDPLRRPRRVRLRRRPWPAKPSSPSARSPATRCGSEMRTRKVDDGAGGLSSRTSSSPSGSRPTRRGGRRCARRWARPGMPVQAFLAHTARPATRPWSSTSPTASRRTATRASRRRSCGPWPRRTATSCCSTPTSPDNATDPIEFPEDEAGLPDDFARLLFRMSSVLPPKLVEAAKSDGFAVGPHSRGFVFNADLVAVIRFLDIGTRVARTVRGGLTLPLRIDAPHRRAVRHDIP